MCDALRELMKEEIDAEIEERSKIAMKEGRKEGMKEGRKEGVIATLSSLVNDGVLNMHEAAERAGMSESVFSANMKKIYG